MAFPRIKYVLPQTTTGNFKGFFAGQQEDAIDNLITVMDLTNAQWWVTLCCVCCFSLLVT